MRKKIFRAERERYCIRVTARRLSERYHLPLIITENGYGRPDILNSDERFMMITRLSICRIRSIRWP
ncbi:hypothetical protein MOZ60_04305 [Stecheria sp. CLA-KB-P133]|uniref:Uncharacterized protein n=1 Tax=Grylomicrobium aquisgranensis TaxID=2926318 RepID=A0AB35U3Q1_9FIRM|nr:hypothetical protein [Stecheria sp. CLA-KB-P133]